MLQLLFGDSFRLLSSPSFWMPLILALLIILLTIRSFRNTIIKAIVWLVNLIPAAVLFVLGVLALPFWRIGLWFANKLLWVLPLDRFAEKLLVLAGAVSASSLSQGNRKAFALQTWPENTYPYLYMDTIPEDIRRPLYEDGRLVGGYYIAWLADRHFGPNVLREAILAGVAAGVLIIIVLTIVAVWSAFSDIYMAVWAVTSTPQGILEHWPGQAPEMIPYSWWFREEVRIVWPQIVNLIGPGLLFTVSSVFLSIGVFLLIPMLVLQQWQKEKSWPYELGTKDAMVRWPYRAETRDLYQAAYRRQIELATNHLKNAPTFLLGKATGILRTRGDLTAPTKDQDLKLDGDSLFQHVLVLGGTGEGKTTGLLKPLMRQIMPMKHFGMYVSDAKGVLWTDAEKIARDEGRGNDVVVIGTAPGQYGVDILANLTPTQIAATLRSVLKQMGSSTGESFWPDMAMNVLRHVLTIAQSYSLTEEGRKMAGKGVHPYSLWWAYQATLNEAMLNEAIQHIRQSVNDLKTKIMDEKTPNEEADRLEKSIKRLYTPESIASIAYLESSWRDMANDTKSGIVANVTQLLDGFAGSPALRERFACGCSEGTISLSAALEGKIVLNALSNIEEGLPARLVSIFLKTILYREARVREAKFKAMSPPRKPQEAPCVVFIDEVQEIVTADPESGLSDATFWNVARSAGLAGVFATQTIAALKQALGEAAASNFLQQTRSKIFFRSEDRDTVEYACWCAGEFERGRVFEDGQRESIEYRAILDKWEPFAPVDPNERIKSGPMLFFSLAKTLLNPKNSLIRQARQRSAYTPDMRFLPQSLPRESSHILMSAMQQSVWRAEELERQYRSQGNEMRPAITPSDMIGMGRWHAYAHIQRAGLARQDIIGIEHDFS